MSGAEATSRLYGDPFEILRRAKGTLAEVPLPVLLDALVTTRRTGALELKQQGVERVILFEAGAPVGCTSNLVAESLGRYLVEKGVLDEPGHLKMVAASAQRGIRLEELLLQVRTIDAAAVNKHLQANLARKILECFRMGDAQFRVLSGGEIPSTPRMNGVQLIFTGVCTTWPAEALARHFNHPPTQRFARLHEPAHDVGELKLSGNDERLFHALARRPSLIELQQEGFDDEAVRRRVCALGVLGYVNRAERVPERAPATSVAARPSVAKELHAGRSDDDGPATAVAQRSGAGRWIAAAIVLCAVAAGAYALTRHAPEPPPAVVEAPPAERPLRQLPAFTAAPTGARAQPHKSPNQSLSASGILLPPPLAEGPNAREIARANGRLAAGDPEAALRQFEQLTARVPSDAQAWYGAAVGLYELGRDAEAKAAASKAIAAEGASAWAHLMVAYFEQQDANLPAAVRHYERFLELAPADPHADDVRAIVDQLKP